MATWLDAKQQFQKRYDVLAQYVQNQLPKDMDTLSKSTASYIAKGGISQDPSQNADYNNAQQAAQNIETNKEQFLKLNSDVSKTLQTISSNSDMSKLLMENGILQQVNQALTKEQGLLQEDVASAELRDELLRTQESNITKHQLFLLGRPLRPSTIPYLWALAVLFIGASLLMFQQMAPPIAPLFQASTTMGEPGMLSQFLADPRLWGSLAGALAIVVIFLSLRIANVL